MMMRSTTDTHRSLLFVPRAADERCHWRLSLPRVISTTILQRQSASINRSTKVNTTVVQYMLLGPRLLLQLQLLLLLRKFRANRWALNETRLASFLSTQYNSFYPKHSS